MTEIAIFGPSRLAGILLVAGLLIGLFALIILIGSGAVSAFSASLQGALEQVAPFAATYRWLILLWAVAWIVQLLGFGLLTYLLLRSGSEQLVILAYTLILVATIFGVLHATFDMNVMLWAAQEAAQSGSIPELYEPLEAWIGNAFRLAYLVHLVGVAGFGWAILRAELLPPWVGWVASGWSVLWFAGGLIGVGAPGLLFIMPAVIGGALLRA